MLTEIIPVGQNLNTRHCTQHEVSMRDFFNKGDQILQIYSHLLKEPLMKKLHFYAVEYVKVLISFCFTMLAYASTKFSCSFSKRNICPQLMVLFVLCVYCLTASQQPSAFCCFFLFIDHYWKSFQNVSDKQTNQTFICFA